MRLAVGAILVAVAAPAQATAPCFDVCHLSQGQPLLVDGAIWVRPCRTVKGVSTCVVERRDLDGRVLATLPGDASDDEESFENAYLEGRTVVQLFYGPRWTDLRKPYPVSRTKPTMTLRLVKSTLVCEHAGKITKRPLGCVPNELSVRAPGATAAPTALAVVIGTCGTKAATREVIAVCEAKP